MKIQIRYNPEMIKDQKLLFELEQMNPEQEPSSCKGVMMVKVSYWDAIPLIKTIKDGGSWVDCPGLTAQFHGECPISWIQHELTRAIKSSIEWWREVSTDPDFVIIDHEGYHWQNKMFAKKPFMGFGGATMACRSIKDGKILMSNNVWHRGTIPEFLWDKYPDTHVRIKVEGP